MAETSTPAPRLWSTLVERLASGVDRDAAYRQVYGDGLPSGRYVLMSVLSAAIAILGLLLSSPAVVIGAMLLSPLMGPIVLLGFSFWMLDSRAALRSLESLGIGLGLALTVSLLVTWASPLKEPTTEILARARPNLFDLLVAACAGLAGGYAVIRRHGETVIGVAIATALMPPVATLGFALGTQNWRIALGALLLLTTNLIAIALAAAAVAAAYGFWPRPKVRNRGWIGRLAVLLIVATLCVPLTVSLETIALEGRATVSARRTMDRLFGPKARITSLQVRDTPAGLEVDGLVATPHYQSDAQEKLAAHLQAAFGRQAHVRIGQVVLADPSQFSSASHADPPSTSSSDERLQALKAAVPFAAQTIAYDPATQAGVVLLDAAAGLDLNSAQALEQGLRKRDGLAAVAVIPPVADLPPVEITIAKSGSAEFAPSLGAQRWALGRWRAKVVEVQICGVSGHRRGTVAETASKALAPLDVQIVRPERARCTLRGATSYLLLHPS